MLYIKLCLLHIKLQDHNSYYYKEELMLYCMKVSIIIYIIWKGGPKLKPFESVAHSSCCLKVQLKILFFESQAHNTYCLKVMLVIHISWRWGSNLILLESDAIILLENEARHQYFLRVRFIIRIPWKWGQN